MLNPYLVSHNVSQKDSQSYVWSQSVKWNLFWYHTVSALVFRMKKTILLSIK